MNKERRKAIEKISDKLTDLQAELEELREAEEEAYDNLPESLQDGEKGDAMQEAIEHLEDADSYIEEAKDALNDAVCL
jgi:t-SNARE complex subunit (syntaxin)